MKVSIVFVQYLNVAILSTLLSIGLSERLGFEYSADSTTELVKKGERKNNTHICWGAIGGLRFILSCYVMFMHIGSEDSFGAFNNLRGLPHVQFFFLLGGYSLAAPMNPVIENKVNYVKARIWAMYPMYLVALVFALIHLLISCRPSTFRPEFHWSSQPDDLYVDGDESKGITPLFCEGTPAFPESYWASLVYTIIVYTFGLALTPFWLLSWWMVRI